MKYIKKLNINFDKWDKLEYDNDINLFLVNDFLKINNSVGYINKYVLILTIDNIKYIQKFLNDNFDVNYSTMFLYFKIKFKNIYIYRKRNGIFIFKNRKLLLKNDELIYINFNPKIKPIIP
jgi:hypothetical protein